MSIIKCPAMTCVYWQEGKCNSEIVEMEDFEYYSTIEKEEKEMSDDDIKCKTYKSIYGKEV